MATSNHEPSLETSQNRSNASSSAKNVPSATPQTGDAVKKPKPCCACPETKSRRDECFLFKGESDVSCIELIELHRQCMRTYGYDV